jgi:GH43 family beta-xylosidase
MTTVFRPAPDAAHGREIWAPELQRIRGRWYIYFAASDGINANHRMYALQAVGDDPRGSYVFRGRVGDESDRWAIDGVALELRRKLYFVWSGWPQAKGDFPQVLYIAAMRDPWTIVGKRHLLAVPEHAWERAVAPLLEGPEPLARRGRMHLVYSAGASWSDDYALGLLSYRGGDPLLASSWRKQPLPVFAKNAEASAFGVGHASFVRSPDGREDWIVYHATDRPGVGWRGRSVRTQPFQWTPDRRPDFGRPVAIGRPLAAPSGTPGASVQSARPASAAASRASSVHQPSAGRKTSMRLLAGMSKRRSNVRPARSAASTTSARRRSPQAGFRSRKSASNAVLPGAAGSPSTT